MSPTGNRRKGERRKEDRRRDLRVPVVSLAKLRFPDFDAFLDEYSLNISRGGIFIKTKNAKPIGTRIIFSLALDDESKLIEGQGEVVRVVPDEPGGLGGQIPGMAIKFTRLDKSSTELIENIIKNYKDKD
ncbi:MAG: TIGR02266 family protein [Deltaproteobacteria bacterium]|nr:MAG: TIGR02266 family protein [Deltaproteobacteria bacterium]